jgi:ethanolamine ammonia-lyase small subunit
LHDVQYCTGMPKIACDLITSAEAREMLGGKRLEPYYRVRSGTKARITPVMRAGSGTRSPLLFNRAEVEKLRDEILAKLNEELAKVTPPADRRLSKRGR